MQRTDYSAPPPVNKYKNIHNLSPFLYKSPKTLTRTITTEQSRYGLVDCNSTCDSHMGTNQNRPFHHKTKPQHLRQASAGTEAVTGDRKPPPARRQAPQVPLSSGPTPRASYEPQARPSHGHRRLFTGDGQRGPPNSRPALVEPHHSRRPPHPRPPAHRPPMDSGLEPLENSPEDL